MSRKNDTIVPASDLLNMLDRLHDKDQELIAKDQELVAKHQELIQLKYENERLKIQLEYSTKEKEKLVGDPSKKLRNHNESFSDESKNCSLNVSHIKNEDMAPLMSTPAHDVSENTPAFENIVTPSKKRKNSWVSNSDEFKDCSLNMSQIKIEEFWSVSTPAHSPDYDVSENIADYAALEQSCSGSLEQNTGEEYAGNVRDATAQMENWMEDGVENHEDMLTARDDHDGIVLDAPAEMEDWMEDGVENHEDMLTARDDQDGIVRDAPAQNGNLIEDGVENYAGDAVTAGDEHGEEHGDMLNTTVCEDVTPQIKRPRAEWTMMRQDFLKKEVTDASMPTDYSKELRTVNADGKKSKRIEPYSCSLCNHDFTNAHGIVAHIESKHGEEGKKLKCIFPFCNHSSRRNELMNHIRAKHTKEELFYCDECTKWFYTARALNEHEERHRYLAQCKKCKKFKSSDVCIFCRI